MIKRGEIYFAQLNPVIGGIDLTRRFMAAEIRAMMDE